MRSSARIALPLLGLVLIGVAMALAGENTSVALLCGIGGGLAIGLGALAHHPLFGAAVSSTLGAGVSVYLTMSHYAAQSGAESVCNINETFNCDAVNTSAYSELFGVPIAVLGLGFYVGVAAFTGTAFQQKEGSDRAPALLLAAAIGACGYSLFLAWASTQIGAWCLFCISLYLTNALLLVAGLLATREDGFLNNLGPALMGQGDRSMSTFVLAGAVAAALGLIALKPSGPTTIERAAEDDIGLLYEQVDGSIQLTGREPSWGRPDAPYVLLEFADYECPYCGEMAKEVKKLVAAHPDLRVIFKHYPLSNICNPNIPSEGHPNACMAAAAAVCAQEQGRFWELNNQMFANQHYLSKDDIRFMAEQLGLDTGALDACMSSDVTGTKVATDVDGGTKAGIWSTPSLFLQNVTAPGQWVKVTEGADGVDLMLQFKAKGAEFPAPRPPTPPGR
ncbi:MAG: thioredoxin domain-containing protein [Alphaproteobacteria bacterium]|nr:thioredoxin domain-containing protein [Alphaproteobacteria bacterium]